MTRSFFSAFIFLLLIHWLVLSGHANQNPVEKDAAGREWVLNKWKDGARPYPRDLGEREKWYREKHGEDWYGPKVAQRIYSPGDWNWEVYHSVPKDMAARLKGRHIWGSSPNTMTFVWAPYGQEITDVYIVADSSVYHYNVVSKKSVFIGAPDMQGRRDGIMEEALLALGRMDIALDHVTGRLYFSQKIERTSILRFIEKLLPYKCSIAKKILYLPSVFEMKKIYEKVKSPDGGQLEPVFENGRRSEPVFVVRTNYSVQVRRLPGANDGKRLLITPNGKGVYYVKVGKTAEAWWLETLYDVTSLFDIETGKMIGKLNVTGSIPENFKRGDAPGTHGGNNLGFDGSIYTAQHGGSGGGPGRMFSINPESGKVSMLYDSMPEDGSWRKMKRSVFDGPADAKSLWFTSTRWQTQCPRTGAIINGGWDNSGIRRYLDGFVTTIVGHSFGGFFKPPRPGWGTDFKNVHRNSNPAVAPNGDLYVADTHGKRKGKVFITDPRIIRIYRTDWPQEQPVNGYAEKYMSKKRLESLRLEYAKKYIHDFDENNKMLEEAGY
jgi:hypothetical protein